MSEGPSNYNKSDYNYWENKLASTTLIKTIERHPAIYNRSLLVRSRQDLNKAWRSVYLTITEELKVDTSTEELKSKWLGIRAAFINYLNKVRQSSINQTPMPRRYHLTDAMRFLIPHLNISSKLPKSLLNIILESDVEEIENNFTKRTTADSSCVEPPVEITSLKVEEESEDDDDSFTTTTNDVLTTNDNKSEYVSWENQVFMTTFVQIIERNPVIYNSDLERSRICMDQAWINVYQSVVSELKTDCSIEELKTKWKGVRSSFGRYLSKCYQSRCDHTPMPTKYYLTDALEFLIPHIKINPKQPVSQPDIKVEPSSSSSACCSPLQDSEIEPYDEKDDDNFTRSNTADSSQVDPLMEFVGLKEEEESEGDEDCFTATSTEVEPPRKKFKEHQDVVENEDLEFYKCILPDIADFTRQEKRKLRVGLLNLISEIESERN